MAWHSPRDIRDCANKPATQSRATACRTELCRSGWDRRAGRLNSTATRRFIARKTFRLIQETRVPDAQVRVSTGPAASGSDRPIPEEAKGTLTWRMVTLATLPMPCRVIAVIQDVLPRQSAHGTGSQPENGTSVAGHARAVENGWLPWTGGPQASSRVQDGTPCCRLQAFRGSLWFQG